MSMSSKHSFLSYFLKLEVFKTMTPEKLINIFCYKVRPAHLPHQSNERQSKKCPTTQLNYTDCNKNV